MPHKKRRNSNNKNTKEQSQPGHTTPGPAAQASTVKPAQFEKASSGSAMATKPGVVTTATGGAAGSGVTAGGSASVGTAGKAKPETTPPSAPGAVAAAGTAATTAVTKPKDAAKSTTAITTVKADVLNVDPAKTSKPAAAAGNVSVQGKKEEAKTSQTKVQVEVPSTTAKGVKQAPAVDPFEALASNLPSADPVPGPVYTGPEVTEHVKRETAHKCGERDDTLPPGYRLKDMPPAPPDVKPKDDSKPLTTDQAMDSLLHDFTDSPAPAAPKKQEKGHVETITASSSGPTNFAPPPVKKGETVPPVAVSPAPTADKKAKTEKVSTESSLKTAQPTKSVAPAAVSPAPPADKKPKMDTKVETKPKTDGGDSLSLDALSALSDTLPADKPKPESPKLKPKDIVSEEKSKKGTAVRVGERDDTIAPEYRFKEEDLKKHPPPKPEPSLDTDDALDILSGDFTTSSAAPAVHAPPPIKKPPGAPAVAVCPGPPADKKAKKDDFSLESGLSATTAKKVESSAVPPVAVCHAPPADKKGKVEKAAAGKDMTDAKPKKDQGDSLSLDALSALSDTLPADKPKPEAPKLKPEDMVSEDKLKKEKGVRVGERDDTIAPEYRFKEEDLKKHPPPKPEPSLDTDDALDILSGDFTTSSVAPAVQAPVQKAACPLEKPSSAGFVSAQPQQGKPKIEKGDSLSLDALNALGDTLPADTPKPESPKLKPEDIVPEDKVKDKKAVRVGEREDTIPPEYRFKEEDLKKHPPPKPEPTMQTGEALDILSGQFSTPAQSSADTALDSLAGEFVASTTASTVKSAACVPTQLEGEADNALDALSDTLKDIPSAPQPVPVPAKAAVKEKPAVEEKVPRMGDRDDTLPLEYRPTEEDRKKMKEEMSKQAKEPKQKSIDDNTALDLLSGDFSAAATPDSPAASSKATTKLERPVPDSHPLKPMAGPVLDSMASTLVPDTPPFKSDKPKKPQAEQPPATNLPTAPLRSDVVPASAKKGGKS